MWRSTSLIGEADQVREFVLVRDRQRRQVGHAVAAAAEPLHALLASHACFRHAGHYDRWNYMTQASGGNGMVDVPVFISHLTLGILLVVFFDLQLILVLEIPLLLANY